ncbi:DUF3137 domain-containing protein [Saprospira grandis]|uniref:Galanin n=1 Tax=Saprospira grandis (strain Lewin) TaxID=984262 RepID=H6KZE9_SAPGL|nr:DUF3137 domain-containing protein [Saprospira grandis]AFC25725.1 Galanin [Saprospira grandis str. Lewin]
MFDLNAHIQEIEQLIPKAEKLRKRKLIPYYLLKSLALIPLAIALLFAYIALSNLDSKAIPIPTGVAAFIFFIGAIVLFSRAGRNRLDRLRSEVKEALLLPLLGQHPHFEYRPKNSLTLDDLRRAGLFQPPPNILKGEDLFVGQIGKFPVDFSEIEAKRRTENRSGNKKKVNISVVFKGIFGRIRLPNSSQIGSTLVIPQLIKNSQNSKWFSWVNDALSLLQIKQKHIEIEGLPEFSERYAVYGDSPEGSRKLLRLDLQQVLLDIAARWERPVYFAFVDQTAYLGLSHKGKRFELSVRQPLSAETVRQEAKVFLQEFQEIEHYMELLAQQLS